MQSVSDAPVNFILIGTPGDRRVTFFQQALIEQKLPPARLVSYLDLIAGTVSLTDLLTPDTIVRIESPGKSQQVERALLALGAELPDPDGERYERISQRALAALPVEKGQLLPSRQWYLGYCHLLQEIKRQLGTTSPMNRPDDIAVMFDKRVCHALLQQHHLAVPPALAPVHCYDELMAGLRQQGWSRVFIKPAHGSSASGIIAYRFQGDRQQAVSTIEMARQGQGYRLYNTRRIRCYTDRAEIATLVDMLCRQRVHVEQWIPKAVHAGHSFDCRIVVIGGEARHAVVRMSKSPFTNLHLLNGRGDLAAVQAACGEPRWQEALWTCEHAASLFGSLYTGVDLLFSSRYQRHAIIEMNAFGDLLPGVLHRGQDTYSAEIEALLKAASYDLCS